MRSGGGATVVAFFVLTLLTAGIQVEGNGMSTPAICTDASGVWNIPDGLVLGGPLDNSVAFATWLNTCDFVAYSTEFEVTLPYADVIESWEECYQSELETQITMALEANATNALVPVQNVLNLTLLGSVAAMTCGTPRTPDTVDENGNVTYVLEAEHLGARHGSIKFSSWSFKDKSGDDDEKAGRISTAFYGNGGEAAITNTLKVSSHWQDAHHHVGRCGGTRYAYIWDAVHGGSNAWWKAGTGNHDQTESHHGSKCKNARYHLRHYGDNVDNHGRNFGEYSIANIHWDDDGHDQPSGAKGVNHLHAERADFSTSFSKYWSDNQQDYIYMYKV